MELSMLLSTVIFRPLRFLPTVPELPGVGGSAVALAGACSLVQGVIVTFIA